MKSPRRVLIGLLLLVLVSLSGFWTGTGLPSGETPPGQPLLEEELWAGSHGSLKQRFDIAPAITPPLVEGRAASTLPIDLAGLADVRVNAIDPPSDKSIQSETTIAVNDNTGTICVVFNDNYLFPDQGLAGFSRSTDGGGTWQDGGSLPVGPSGATWGDPSVAWRRADGCFYYTGLLPGLDGLGLWRSTSDCASFHWLSFVYAGTQDDKEFMAIDNNPASPYYGRFYVAWTDLVSPRRISLVYSDNGSSWTGPFALSTPGDMTFGAWPAVAPNGDLYVVWLNWVVYDTTISVEGVRSTNGGNTFTSITSPMKDAVAPRDAQATINCDIPSLKANVGDGIRYFAMPQIAVGPDSCLHVVYSYDADGYNVGDVVDVFYRRSCDHGTTWGPEVRLNDDSGLTDQFFPAVAVNADNLVAAAWYDRRDDPQNNYLFRRYWTLSYDGGTTWEPNERISDFPSAVYPASNCYHGDYDQMTTYGDSIYHLWSDDRLWFNGHWDPDIWFDQFLIGSDFTLEMAPQEHSTCRGEVVTSTVTVSSVRGYDQPVTLDDSGLPAGVQTAFTVNPVNPLPGTSTYIITVTNSAAPGTYAWSVSGSSATLSHDLTVTLVVSDCCDPVHDVDFAWTRYTPTAGQMVTFTGTATGTLPITYTWDFGDGSGATAPCPLPLATCSVTHTYALPGDYAVVLTATNCVSATAQASAIITVLPEPVEHYAVYLPLVTK